MVKKEGALIRSIVLGVAMVIVGLSGNLALAQTTTTTTTTTTSLTTSSTGLVALKPKAVSVPEPASLILLGAGLAGLGILRRAARKD